ncbi:OsmC family protein [Kosmotoga pacifica]|uniref:Osmotically inducible protein C n=1 Tax=Kosmotoga pacifica TaxID=1330330 RepID=A0A0G2ZEU7_9BACT|nr:OsmC family protein [Kosmotoga pacifica]AKI97358.1 osmotically inducible protein C [Kosmotoga pacifica]
MNKDFIFKVTAKSESISKTVIKARNFNIVVDEPPMLGGKDEGPNPVEFVLAALAGCLNVVGHLVAREMGFQIKNLEFEISGALNPEKFMGKETSDRAGYKSIEVKMNIDADVDELTLARWLEIMKQRCPVSDNLTNATPVNITLNSKAESKVVG